MISWHLDNFPICVPPCIFWPRHSGNLDILYTIHHSYHVDSSRKNCNGGNEIKYIIWTITHNLYVRSRPYVYTEQLLLLLNSSSTSIIYDIIVFATADAVKTYDFCRDNAVKLNQPDKTTMPVTTFAVNIIVITNFFFFTQKIFYF